MKQKLLKIFSCCLFSMIFVACGAKDEGPAAGNGSGNTIQGQETDELKNQTPICYDTDKNCPSYVAKIVVSAGTSKKHCTGVLVGPNTMMTSATCLPQAIRSAGKDCSRLVHIFFPETKNNKADRYYCDQVISASDVDPGVDPSLWENNVALISLKSSVNRDYINPVNSGLKLTEKVEVWKVSTEIANGSSSFIKRFDCDVVPESYANPFNNHQYSPNSTLGNCSYKDASNGEVKPESSTIDANDFAIPHDGSEGAAVLVKGKFAGLVGKQSYTDQYLQELKKKGIVHDDSTVSFKPMNFVSNLACMGAYFKSGSTPPECDLTYNEDDLIEKRKAIASSNVAAGLDEAKARIRVATQWDTGSHMVWQAEFSAVKNQQVFTKHIPICYYNPFGPTGQNNGWLKKEFHRFLFGYKAKQDTEMTIDGYIIDIKLDGNLKPRALYKKADTIKYGMTIRPKDISNNKDSELSVRGKFAGVDFDEAYYAIPICK